MDSGYLPERLNVFLFQISNRDYCAWNYLFIRIISSFLAQWIKVFTNTYNTKIQDADVEKKTICAMERSNLLF